MAVGDWSLARVISAQTIGHHNPGIRSRVISFEQVADFIKSKTKLTAIHGLRTHAYSHLQQHRIIDMKCDFNRTVTYEDICQAIQDLAEEGLIVDSGRKKWSERSGQYEIVWMLSPIERETATGSITSCLSL